MTMARIPGCLAGLPRLDRCVDDRNEETQRLARAGARCDGVAPIAEGITDSLLPMLEELERSVSLAAGVRHAPKHLGPFRCQIACVDEILYRTVVSVVRVQLNQRLSPETPGGVRFRRPWRSTPVSGYR